MGQLAEWREQKWVRIGTDGSIKGPCGTSKDKKIQIDAFLLEKLIVYQKKKEQKQLKRKKLLLKKGKQLYQIHPKLKSN
jgi:histidinol phosphatase-like PHP family hydrolase